MIRGDNYFLQAKQFSLVRLFKTAIQINALKKS